MTEILLKWSWCFHRCNVNHRLSVAKHAFIVHKLKNLRLIINLTTDMNGDYPAARLNINHSWGHFTHLLGEPLRYVELNDQFLCRLLLFLLKVIHLKENISHLMQWCGPFLNITLIWKGMFFLLDLVEITGPKLNSLRYYLVFFMFLPVLLLLQAWLATLYSLFN